MLLFALRTLGTKKLFIGTKHFFARAGIHLANSKKHSGIYLHIDLVHLSSLNEIAELYILSRNVFNDSELCAPSLLLYTVTLLISLNDITSVATFCCLSFSSVVLAFFYVTKVRQDGAVKLSQQRISSRISRTIYNQVM